VRLSRSLLSWSASFLLPSLSVQEEDSRLAVTICSVSLRRPPEVSFLNHNLFSKSPKSPSLPQPHHGFFATLVRSFRSFFRCLQFPCERYIFTSNNAPHVLPAFFHSCTFSSPFSPRPVFGPAFAWGGSMWGRFGEFPRMLD